MNLIDPRIHQALDGELAAEALPAELRSAVAQVAAAADLLAAPLPFSPLAPGASLEARVMAAIRRPAPSRARRLVRWLVIPHAIMIRVRPAWSLAFAAAVALLTLFTAGGEGPELAEHEGIAQFVGRFPDAQSVHAVGTFNDWRPGSIALEDHDHDGVWRATVVLPAGTYEYMFVVDGERWVPDHLAERLVADEFGRENSIVIVRPVRR
jgi:AMP-activated protein kinase-like protein